MFEDCKFIIAELGTGERKEDEWLEVLREKKVRVSLTFIPIIFNI